MKEIVFENYRIQVDAEATRAYYDAHGEIAGGCGCAYCRNFAAAAEAVSPQLRTFLDDLGLDLRKPCEAMELGPGTGNRRLYEAFTTWWGSWKPGTRPEWKSEKPRWGFMRTVTCFLPIFHGPVSK